MELPRRRAMAAAGLLLCAAAALLQGSQCASDSTAALDVNPSNMFTAAMRWPNVYQTPNYYVGAYHYIQCHAHAFVVPSSTAEVAAAVGLYYNLTRRGQAVTFRASRPMFHSSQAFPCPNPPERSYAPTAGSWATTTERGASAARMPSARAAAARTAGAATSASAAKATAAKGEAGPLPPVSVGLLQTKMNKVLAADKSKWTMRVQPGMRWTEFLQEATKAGMSVQLGTPTAYAGLTLGGVLATTSHGSGDQTTSAIWDTLLEIVWVDGRGKVRVSKPDEPEFKAMVGGLGLIGVMTELHVQMTPPSATTLITVRRKDTNMMADVNELLKITPHVLIFWRPDISSFKAFLLKKAAPGERVTPNTVASLLPSIAGRERGAAAFRIMSSQLQDDSDAFGALCPLQTEASLSSSWASVNGRGYANITGPTNSMQASECDEHCNWNENSVFFGTAQDVEFTTEYDRLGEWIDDVKQVFKRDLFEGGRKSFRCMGPGYLWIRFGAGYDGYTATMSGMKRPVFLQSTWLRSRATPDYPIRYQFIIDTLEQLTLCKYDGRAHWGKNFERTFLHPTCKTRAKYPHFDKLLALQAQHDPARMFEPRLFSRMAKGEKYQLSPGCSLWQRCYCETDEHCSKGHKCVASAAFPEYKACKPALPNLRMTLWPQVIMSMVMGAGNN